MSTVAAKGEQDVTGYDDIGLETGVLPDTRELPAWGVSLVVHVVLLMVFWMWRLSSQTELAMDIPSQLEQQQLDKQVVKVAVAQDTVGNGIKANMPTPAQKAALQRGRDPQKELDRQLRKDNLVFVRPEPEPILQPSRDDLVATVQANGETRDVGGTEGALDVLTREIEASLRERKTLVVWLFDASQSLNVRRKLIADRFENVYKQLTSRNENVYKVLKTGVVSYGERTTFLTDEPVDDVRDVIRAVRNIKPDKSGREYVFTAVSDILARWKSRLTAYRSATEMRRNVMFIIVTDERGDDFNGKSGQDYTYLDRVIRDLRRLDIRVYCVGNAALFGREKGFVSFTDETGYQWDRLSVDQGPESVAPQRLQLPFWGNVPRNVENLSANYGPYALTRLCSETGGLFLIAEHSVGAVKFPPDVMRKYRPFYGPIPVYVRDIQQNRAKQALDKVARMKLRESIPRPQLVFRAENDNVLRQGIARAQRPLARLNYDLREILAVMEVGEKDRPKLQEDRWRAAFDLAMGRLLATYVRAFGYQSMLAEMSSSPKTFKNPRSNQWRLVPSKNWDNYPPNIKKLAKKAVMYLKRVIDEHPETPWALLAEYELGEGRLGWEWREAYSPAPKERRGNNRNRILLADENNPRRKMQKKKQSGRKKPEL